ncbi:MAG: hypothetical protein R6V03_03600 [Kiritimatiellia bacterium]
MKVYRFKNAPSAWFAVFVIITAGVMAYANSFSGVFLYDDLDSILHNPAVRSFPECVRGSSRPLVHLSFWLNYTLGGYDLRHYHLFNVVVHIANALFFFGIVLRTAANLQAESKRGAYGTTGVLVALGASLLWMVHPLQTESVTYIVQRSESMAGMFVLLALYGFIRSRGSANSRVWLILSASASAAGMTAKAVAVITPLVILLYDRAFLTGSLRRSLRERTAFYAALAAGWGILLVLAGIETESSLSAGYGANIISPAGYLFVQGGVILHYLRMVIWPDPLCLNYSWSEPGSVLSGAVPWAVVAALLVLSIYLFRRFPAVGFPALWFFVTVAPASSVFPLADYAAEHRMYLPLAGPAVLASAGIFAGWRKTVRSARAAVRVIPPAVLLVLFAGVLAIGTRARNRDYHSAEAMWRSVIDCRPESHGGRVNLCRELIESGRYEEAEKHAGYITERLARFGRMKAGEAERRLEGSRGFEFGKRLSHYVKAHTDLGIIHTRKGNYARAESHLAEALRLMPGAADTHWNMARLKAAQKDTKRCLQEVNTVLELEPAHPYANISRGLILKGAGHRAEAARCFERALQYNPSLERAAYELAWVRATAFEERLRDGQAALKLAVGLNRKHAGTDPKVLNLLAAAYAETGDFAEAVRAGRRALLLVPAESGLADDLRKRLEAYRRCSIPAFEGAPVTGPQH